MFDPNKILTMSVRGVHFSKKNSSLACLLNFAEQARLKMEDFFVFVTEKFIFILSKFESRGFV